MKRVIYFAAGAGAGVYAMVRARRVAETFTADGLRDRARAAKVGLQALREDVAVAQEEKETELRERFGVPHALGSPAAADPASTQALPSATTSDIENDKDGTN